MIPKKNDAFKAVLSRCDIFELSATNEEVLELMRSISAKGFRGLTPEDCTIVIDYIGEHCEDRKIPPGSWGRRSGNCSMPERKVWTGGRWSKPSCRPSAGSSLQPSDWTPGCRMFGYFKMPSLSTRIPCKTNRRTGAREHGKSRASYFRTVKRYREEMKK